MGAIKRNIPNFITCLNLACGCMGIAFAMSADMLLSVYFIFLAAVFDFLDGFFARLLKVTSPIGRDLDSLADVVTFGVLPSVMLVNLLQASMYHAHWFEQSFTNTPFLLVSAVAFLTTVFSAIRLARFNNDPGQSLSFKGLPTPANGLFIASFFYWVYKKSVLFTPITLINSNVKETELGNWHYIHPNLETDLVTWASQPFFLLALIVVLSFLLIAPIQLMAFKFKGFGWKANQWKYILLILCLPLIIWLKFASAPIILILYILISQIHFRTQRHEIQS